jgi:hypothetical protein
VRAAVLLALLPSLAFGQAAPWLNRCTDKLPKHPEMVDVPPTNDRPGGWLLTDGLVCGIDAELRKKSVVVYRDRQVEVTRAAPVLVALVLGVAGGVALTLALQKR